MLGVLDAKASIPCAVFSRDALEDIEDGRVGAIPNRVDDHVEPGLVGPGNPGVHVFRRVHEQPSTGGRIRERLVECSRV